ncbi:MAG: ABC transporter permease [Acidobacteria bacterium]|nr:ABC transporter permease [Acidobacteriota bacterium]
MATLLQDVRYGVRMFFKTPGFSLIAVLTLALGIGANTAIFSVVNAVILKPLPYSEPERIVRMYGKFSQGNQAATSPPDFLDYRAQNHTFEEFAATRSGSFNLTGGVEPERILGADVTANFFQTLGIKLVQGRTFSPEEEQEGKERVAIISEALWQRRFGGDANVIGKTLSLDGQHHTIVGIAPNLGRIPDETDVWRPLTFDRPNMKIRRFHFLRAFGRLKSGVTMQQAQADVDAIAVGLEKQYPESNTSWRLRMVALRDELLGNVRTPLYVLLGAVAFVLLIACANVANLLLARAAGRQKEIAIRCALGAGRWRLTRQLLTESILLSIVGGAIGFLLALWGTEALVKLAADSVPRAGEIGMDKSVLGFTMLLSVLTGVIFGLVPAWQASRQDINESLKDGSKGTAARNMRTRGGLVVAEIALALILLVGAGLLVQSFWRLQDVDPGFNPRNVLTMRMFLPESKYAEEGRSRAFFEQVLQRVAALPGVQAVGTTTQLPMRGGGDTYFKIEGRPFQGANQQVTALNPTASHDYFRAMGIPLLKGRAFTEQETKETAKVVIINESFARTYFSDEDPLGKRLIIDDGQPLTCEIIGVARDIKQFSLASQSSPTMYMPSIETGFANLVVRTSGDPLALASAVRTAVQSVDKDQPVFSVRSMEQVLATSVAEPRFRTILLGVFAAVALGLATIGIYGVMAYTVAQRTHEIGIRMALGAGKSDVLWLVVKQGMALTIGGIVLGIGAALALTRLLSGLLFGVGADDPLTFVLIAVMLTTVALLACWIPARSATKVDPLIALRQE